MILRDPRNSQRPNIDTSQCQHLEPIDESRPTLQTRPPSHHHRPPLPRLLALRQHIASTASHTVAAAVPSDAAAGAPANAQTVTLLLPHSTPAYVTTSVAGAANAFACAAATLASDAGRRAHGCALNAWLNTLPEPVHVSEQGTAPDVRSWPPSQQPRGQRQRAEARAMGLQPWATTPGKRLTTALLTGAHYARRPITAREGTQAPP